jgi:hypothetical protein
MSSRFDHNNNSKSLEGDKSMQVFKQLEAMNLRNKAAFHELLKYTYSNVNPSGSPKPDPDNRT